ncbi:hypothetical protein Tco_1092987 [Tanacetum coccineum]|uniref:Uncharacterized protein n=1 Tax=Tanacetum coccineum TaxID=301880 RepID=A0ABQ5ICS3_9ASTR
MTGPKNTNKLLAKLITQLGNLGITNTSPTVSTPVAYTTGLLPSASPTVGPTPPPGLTSLPNSLTDWYPHSATNQSENMGPSGQATILPHAFTVGTLHDPASGA